MKMRENKKLTTNKVFLMNELMIPGGKKEKEKGDEIDCRKF